ncbi:MAG: hypothetical protein ACR2L2_19515 [Acidobacteriota bacterium]
MSLNNGLDSKSDRTVLDWDSHLRAWLQRYSWPLGVASDRTSTPHPINLQQAGVLGAFAGKLHARSFNVEASFLFARPDVAPLLLHPLATRLPSGRPQQRARQIIALQLLRRDCLVHGNMGQTLAQTEPLTVGGWQHAHFGGMTLDVAAFLSGYPALFAAFWKSYREAAPPWSSDDEVLMTGLAALLRSDAHLLRYDLSIEDFIHAVGG